ncbi:zinc-dependent alcohol dehydrogenase family protein [Derxia lacustris]|uniref:zinc-dependent alcohol dehydrogenase family protein n=1 Tax=Derxia lacustris TaxID=764842 RepID=UPI000A171EDE|nr:NAD(P)-dependent alcohol dehydrogenase [Derxia lacustris]
MNAYRIPFAAGIDALAPSTETPRPLALGEVRLKLHAASLNFRDLMVATGSYFAHSETPVIPCSDGAGEVIETGPGATRFKLGDRVCANFFPHWVSGAQTPAGIAGSFGGADDGMLAEQAVVPEHSLVAIPEHLSFLEAATLPCAAVTAWNALFVAAGLKPGASVLLLGTGGVSIWALQLAKAAGIKVVITSSSDDKLARAKALGADVGINYRSTPEWQDAVLAATGGEGVDLVVEVGGQGTLERSVAAAKMGGTIAIIGGVSGFGGAANPLALIGGAKKLAGIFVGSRAMFEDMNRLISNAGIRPIIDRVFPFAEAKAAYRHLASGNHFGKVVVQISG